MSFIDSPIRLRKLQDLIPTNIWIILDHFDKVDEDSHKTLVETYGTVLTGIQRLAEKLLQTDNFLTFDAKVKLEVAVDIINDEFSARKEEDDIRKAANKNAELVGYRKIKEQLKVGDKISYWETSGDETPKPLHSMEVVEENGKWGGRRRRYTITGFNEESLGFTVCPEYQVVGRDPAKLKTKHFAKSYFITVDSISHKYNEDGSATKLWK